jgi:hypothetical protein
MGEDRQMVKQLDHLIVRVDNPRPLFELLSETLGLPIAWPMQSFPSFTSGGVTLGNLYLEILSCAPAQDLSSRRQDARFAAIAFEAETVKGSIGELERRQIPHGPIVPYAQIEPDGSKTELYANVILGKLLGSNFWIDTMIMMSGLPGASAMANPGAGSWLTRWGVSKVMSGNLVFLVRYAYENFVNLPHWSEFKHHDEKRAADKEALQARQGGALGIKAVKEIVAGVKDFEGVEAVWRQFLAPVPEIAPGIWEIADGPRVHLVSSGENSIKTLVLKVSSLKRAETFLAGKGMLGALDNDCIRLAPEKIHGLDVHLVQE